MIVSVVPVGVKTFSDFSKSILKPFYNLNSINQNPPIIKFSPVILSDLESNISFTQLRISSSVH